MGEQRTALFLLLILCFAISYLPLVRASPEMWSQTYGGEYDDVAYGLVETSDGGYALAGFTESFGAGSYDFWLVKIDGSGNLEWNRTYGGTGDDGAHSLVETSDGGYALAGKTRVVGGGSTEFWLVRTDALGIPEFPSWIILPLFMIATFAVIIYRRRLRRRGR